MQEINLPTILLNIEWLLIEGALMAADGHQKNAAKLLGIKRTTMIEKINRRKRMMEKCLRNIGGIES